MKKVVVPMGIVKMYFDIAKEEAKQKGMKFKDDVNDPVIQKIMHKHLTHWYKDSVVPSVVGNPSTAKVSLDKIEGFEQLFSEDGMIGEMVKMMGSRNPRQYVTAIKGSVMHLTNVFLELNMKMGKDTIRRSSTFALESGDKANVRPEVFQNRLYRATMTIAMLAFLKRFYETEGSKIKEEIARLFPVEKPETLTSHERRNEYLLRLSKRLDLALVDYSIVSAMKSINLEEKGTQK